MGRRPSLSCAWMAALALVTLGPSALANGRAPSIIALYPRAGGEDLAVWSTWGLLLARGEAGFRWMCETALKVGGSFDPDMLFLADGALLVTSFEGVLVNRDGCAFQPTGLGGRFVSRIAQGPDGAIYAAAVERADGAIYKSTDGGATFPISFAPGMPGDWWQSLEVAPSDASRVYLTGYRLGSGSKQPLFYRSDDGGRSYRAMPAPQAQAGLASDTELAAVSPTNPDLLFARVTYAMGDDKLGDRIYRSADGGTTWTEVLYAAAPIPGVVVRRSGEVLAATAGSGAWRSSDGGETFVAEASSLQVQCLLERPDGTLLACGQNFAPDDKAIASSVDGRTWLKVFRFAEAKGPVDCSAGTLQCDTCQLEVWCGLREQLGIAADPTTCDEPGGDGTTCGGPLPVEDPAGCCGATARPGAGQPLSSALLLAMTGLGLWRWRRRSR